MHNKMFEGPLRTKCAYNQCQMCIHQCYVTYIDVMCNKRCSMRLDLVWSVAKSTNERINPVPRELMVDFHCCVNFTCVGA